MLFSGGTSTICMVYCCGTCLLGWICNIYAQIMHRSCTTADGELNDLSVDDLDHDLGKSQNLTSIRRLSRS